MKKKKKLAAIVDWALPELEKWRERYERAQREILELESERRHQLEIDDSLLGQQLTKIIALRADAKTWRAVTLTWRGRPVFRFGFWLKR